MLIISLATASTVLTLNTYKKGDEGEPVPEILQRVFFDIVARLLFMRVKVDRSKSKKRETQNKSKCFWQNNNNSSPFNSEAADTITKINQTYENMNGGGCRAAPFTRSLLLKDPNNRSIYLFENQQSSNSSVRESANIIENSCMEKTSLILKPSDMANRKRNLGSFKSSSPLGPTIQQQKEGEYSIRNEKKLARLMRNLSFRLETYEKSREVQERRAEIKNEWTELARVIDALLGYTFVITSICLLAYLVLKTPNFRFY